MKRTLSDFMFAHQRGLTLVELMVALVMGLILLAGLATVFVANKQTYRYQETLASLQENGRFALSMLERDIRSAGAGVNIDARLSQNNVAPTGVKKGEEGCNLLDTTSLGGAIEGYDADANADEISGLGLNKTPLPGTDVLRVSSSYDLGVDIIKDPGNPGANNPAARLDITGCPILDAINQSTPGAVFTVVTKDGQAYSIYQLSSVECQSDGTGNMKIQKNQTTAGVGVWNCDFILKADFTGGYVLGTQSTVYFVANTGRNDAQGQPIPALFRAVNRGNAEELVEGVESMRLNFAVGKTQIAEKYLRPADVWNAVEGFGWDDARGVRVQLLLRSVQPKTLTAANPTDFSPTEFFSGGAWSNATNTDGRWRQVYSTTVAVRNRLP
jgi:type IV pilus assembly protein PilW